MLAGLAAPLATVVAGAAGEAKSEKRESERRDRFDKGQGGKLVTVRTCGGRRGSSIPVDAILPVRDSAAARAT